MTPSSPILRAVSQTASAAVLALCITLPASGAALADSPEPTGSPTATTTAPECPEVCTPEPTSTNTAEPRPTRTSKPDDDSWQPAPAPPGTPQPAAPSSPAPAAPAPDAGTPAGETEGPAATESPAEETPSPSATTPSSGAPSSGSNWNTPVTRSAKSTQAAAVTRAGGGPDGANLPAVAAGVLLVGAGGGAFAWWGRNRLRAH